MRWYFYKKKGYIYIISKIKFILFPQVVGVQLKKSSLVVSKAMLLQWSPIVTKNNVENDKKKFSNDTKYSFPNNY